MKKIIVLALLLVSGVYAKGWFSLGETGAMRFVMDMNALMSEGKADEVCAMFHDDLAFSIADHTAMGAGATHIEGGKQDLCDVTHEQVDALRKVPHTMQTEFDDLQVVRSWLHPLTSEVSYTENRRFTIRGANMSINTTSEDTLTLVQTFSGVKMLKLQAKARVTE